MDNIFSEKLKKQKDLNMVSILPENLFNIIYNLFLNNGIAKEHAYIIADCMTEADMSGVFTHGVNMLPAHIKKINNRGYNIEPNFRTISKGESYQVIDADNAIGFVSAAHCMNIAVNECEEKGIFTVFSRNSNTYGPGFYYPNLAVKEGMIGIAFSNSPAAMAPSGGLIPMIGTNPLSISIPTNEKPPIVFDMATSIVAKSKFNEARKKGEKIPFGWALNSEGEPTNDPLEAIKGLVLPMANHKGLGLALMIDILAGMLSGAASLNNVGKFYSDDNKAMNVGQTFIAINPRIIYGEDFYNEMDKYIDKLKNSTVNSEDTVTLPGDNKNKNRKNATEYGIMLDKELVKEINEMLNSYNLNEYRIEVN